MRYQLCFFSRTPLSFKATRSSSDAKTLDYIPGTSLLGAMAKAHQIYYDDQEEFQNLFFGSGLMVGNCYPIGDEVADYRSLRSGPFPSTSVTCKRFPGFKGHQDEEAHGIRDLLKEWTAYALSDYKKDELLLPPLECPYGEGAMTCKANRVPVSSYYQIDFQKRSFSSSFVKKKMITGTGIDRKTGTVRSGVIYNREVILEKQYFTGEISIHEKARESLQEFLKTTSPAGYLRVGNSRSRGLGEVSTVLITEKPYQDVDSIKENINRFTQGVTQLTKEYGIYQPYQYLVPLTFHSDTILMDDFLRYSTCLDEDLFEEQISPSQVKLVYGSYSNYDFMGWNSFLGLPREKELVIKRGSVFVFGLEGEPGPTFFEDLYQLQIKGLGERRREGFGRVLVADIFHQEVFEL